MATESALDRRVAAGRLQAAWHRLVAPVPIRRRAFWAVQVLVVGIAIAHTVLESADRSAVPPALYLVPSSLFFVPVVYAALKFGARGAVPTALLSIVLTLPNLLFFHIGMERLGETWQGVILIAVGVFVGVRVDHERIARLEVEDRERARRSSEERYRELFENSAEDANPAAVALIGLSGDSLLGKTLESVIGAGIGPSEDGPDANRRTAQLVRPGGTPPTWVEVIVSAPLHDPTGRTHLQTMLHDVSLRHEREEVLEGYARQTVAAREEERRRIGRELHDGPLQSLVLLSRKLDVIADRSSPTDMPATIDAARQIIDGTADELRRITRALRPPILDDLGLVPALRSETSAFGRRSAVQMRFEQTGRARPLPPEVELMLLRVTQEALHNVERHAGASHVDVRLSFDSTRVMLRVHDDGRGLGTVPPTADLIAAGKLGIAGMQERARVAGATLRVRADLHGGTLVEADWASAPEA
jgi:signal transduction histidine kinase